MEPEKLAKMTQAIFARKGLSLTPQELHAYIVDFIETANLLNLHNNDEAFNFLILLAAHNALYKGEIKKLRHATKEGVADLQASFEKMEKTAEKTAKTSALEIENTCKQATYAKTLSMWIGGGILASCLAISGLCWLAFNQGKKVGMAQQRNEEIILQERDSFSNSEIGQKLAKLYKNGFLDHERLAFLTSKNGEEAYNFYKINRLGDVIRFFNSPMGEAVDAYMTDLGNKEFMQILQCTRNGWKIQKNSAGTTICIPAPEGAYPMPDLEGN